MVTQVAVAADAYFVMRSFGWSGEVQSSHVIRPKEETARLVDGLLYFDKGPNAYPQPAIIKRNFLHKTTSSRT